MKEKKKRGCCGIFLWILIIIIGLVVALVVLLDNGTLDEWFGYFYGDSIESMANATVLNSLEFDINDTSDPDPDFIKLMGDYEDYLNEYRRLSSQNDNPVIRTWEFMRMRSKAKNIEKKMAALENKTLSLSEYNYLMEVMERVNNSVDAEIQEERANARNITG